MAEESISCACDIRYEWKHLHVHLESTRTSRLAHFLLTKPFFGDIALQYLFKKLRYGYDVVSAFLVAREEALGHVQHALAYAKGNNNRVSSLPIFRFHI